MPLVELKQVSKVINGQTILHPLDLTLRKGEFVAIIGPSGSGKSTLLRMIAGLDHPTSGHIHLNGTSLNELAPAKRDIAMVFQDYALYPHMTVFDNMAYGLKMRKYAKSEIRDRVEQVAQRLGLTPQLKKKPTALSGGQKQRVAMGRALVRTPSLYLFDEPLSNLDVSLRAQIRMEIKTLHQTAQITALYVTHDQMEAMTLASRIMILNHGKIEQFDTPTQIYAEPANVFVGTFMGAHPMNLIEGIIHLEKKQITLQGGINLPLPALSFPVSSEVKVWVGIRPEDMRVGYDQEFKSCLPVETVYIENMGADLLVRLKCSQTGSTYLVRLPAKACRKEPISKLMFRSIHAHLFLASTGERIGGWNEEDEFNKSATS